MRRVSLGSARPLMETRPDLRTVPRKTREVTEDASRPPEPSLDAIEHEGLCDLLNELGPGAPTLLEPWTTHDLAAHLVIHEHDYSAAPGLVVPGAWGRLAERRRNWLPLGRTTPPSSRRFDQDRRPGSFASGGCAASRTSTSSSFTMRMSAEPTVSSHGRTPPHWTKRCGAMSAWRGGSSHGDYAASGSSSSGWGRRRSCEHAEESRLPASPDCRASCCSTSSAVRARPTSRSAALETRSRPSNG